MAIYYGSTQIADTAGKIKLGGQDIKEVYYGSQKVWPSTVPPPQVTGYLTSGSTEFDFETDAGFSVTQAGVSNSYPTGVQTVTGLNDIDEFTIDVLNSATFFNFIPSKPTILSCNLRSVGAVTILENFLKSQINMTVFECDADLSGVTELRMTWFECMALITFPNINTPNVERFDATWGLCTNLESITSLDTSRAYLVRDTFGSCSSLQCIGGTLDFSNLTDGSNTFANCTSLTQPPATGTAVRNGDDALAGTWTNPGTCP